MIREALLSQPRFQQVSVNLPIPAPFGGWNERDGLATMDPLDAVVIDNWEVDTASIRLRKGDRLFTSGLTGEVEFLFEHRSQTGTKFLAAASGDVLDITTGTAISLGTGFTNARWSAENLGNQTTLVNGADAPQSFDGTTLTAAGFTSADVAVATLNTVTLVRSRLWFTAVDRAAVFFGGLGAVTGALSEFDLAGVEGSQGGFAVKVASWSRDAGDGMDDFTVFVMSTGEVIVYQGDPATTFSKVGSYNASPPLGNRATVNQGGELIIMTREGYMPLTAIMMGRFGEEDAISSKIRDAVAEIVKTSGNNFGFQAIKSPDGKFLIFNVPVETNITYEQHIINIFNGSWFRFVDRNARTFGVFNNLLFFGTSGSVFQADVGNVDESRPNASGSTWESINVNWEAFNIPYEVTSAPVTGKVQQAFSSLNQPSRPIGGGHRQVTAVRPLLKVDADTSITFGVLANFNVADLSANQQVIDINVAISDIWENRDINWDLADDIWGIGNEQIANPVLVVNNQGESFAPFISTVTGQSIEWFNTEVIFREGGLF